MNRLLFLLFTAAAFSAAAPDASDLLAKARKALGHNGDLKSLVVTGAHRVSSRQPGSAELQVSNRELTLSVLFPSRLLKEETMEAPFGGPGPVLVEGFDGEKAWNDTRQRGGGMIVMRFAGPDATEEMKTRRLHETFARYLLAMTLSTHADMPVEFSYAGQAEAPDGKADVLDAKGPNGFAVRVFLDSKSHLPLMLTYSAPEPRMVINRRAGPGRGPGAPEKRPEVADMPKPEIVEYQVRPSEFRKFGGVLLPAVITWTVKGAVVEQIDVKKYTVNGPLSPDLFRKN